MRGDRQSRAALIPCLHARHLTPKGAIPIVEIPICKAFHARIVGDSDRTGRRLAIFCRDRDRRAARLQRIQHAVAHGDDLLIRTCPRQPCLRRVCGLYGSSQPPRRTRRQGKRAFVQRNARHFHKSGIDPQHSNRAGSDFAVRGDGEDARLPCRHAVHPSVLHRGNIFIQARPCHALVRSLFRQNGRRQLRAFPFVDRKQGGIQTDAFRLRLRRAAPNRTAVDRSAIRQFGDQPAFGIDIQIFDPDAVLTVLSVRAVFAILAVLSVHALHRAAVHRLPVRQHDDQVPVLVDVGFLYSHAVRTVFAILAVLSVRAVPAGNKGDKLIQSTFITEFLRLRVHGTQRPFNAAFFFRLVTSGKTEAARQNEGQPERQRQKPLFHTCLQMFYCVYYSTFFTISHKIDGKILFFAIFSMTGKNGTLKACRFYHIRQCVTRLMSRGNMTALRAFFEPQQVHGHAFQPRSKPAIGRKRSLFCRFLPDFWVNVSIKRIFSLILSKIHSKC